MDTAVIVGGRDVGHIGLGTAPLAFSGIPFTDAVATVRAALDAGVGLIDTAPAYTRPGHDAFAESAVAAALQGRADRENVMVATKGGHRRAGDTFPVDASRAALRSDCDRSLRALGVDAIELYQLHHVDPHVPLVDSVGALRDLQQEGRVRQIGLSNVDIGQIEQALMVAPIASVQNRLSYSHRADLATARHCATRGIAYLAYMPLGGARGGHAPDHALLSVAARHGVSVHRVQLAWLLGQDAPVLPLVGATRPATIADSAAAVGLRLSDSDMLRLGRNPESAL
jgi:aryl-alcohol dehydrogenase-like predicted oxidoreductase